MKVLLKQYLGQNHSWAVCGRGLARSFAKDNDITLYSTDGLDNIGDLRKYICGYSEKNENGGMGKKFLNEPSNDFDLQISYSIPFNYEKYFKHSKVKFGIWCHEWVGKNILPSEMTLSTKFVDKILVPTTFAKNILIDSSFKESKIEVVPHGVDESFKDPIPFDFKRSDKFKIFINIAQPHKRKNLKSALEAYCKAFTKNDDVCLLLKCNPRKEKLSFDDSVYDILNDINSRYKNKAEILILKDYVDSIASYYAGVDATFTMSHCEGYYFPGHESLVCGKLNIAPNFGGQLDFLNSENSLLIDGKLVNCPKAYMYTFPHSKAYWFEPDIDLAVDALRYAYNNHKSINDKLYANRQNIFENTNWDKIKEKIINIKDNL